MLPIKEFNPASSPSGGQIAINATDPGARILFYNESNNNISLDFMNGNRDTLHAWEARWWTLDGNTDQIDWTIDSTLSSLASPISLVMGTIYGPDEELPGVYPISLIRQTNVGNTINTVGGVANSIQNDGNAAGTSLIESTVSGDTVSAVTLNNVGQQVLGNSTHIGSLDVTNPSGDHTYITGDGIGIPGSPWLFVDTRTNQTKIYGASNGAGNGVGLGGNGSVDVRADVNGLTILSGALTVPANASSLDGGAITTSGAGALAANGNISTQGGLSAKTASSLDNGKITTDGAGNEIFSNGQSIQWKDSGGTARAVMAGNASNVLVIRAIAGAGGRQIQLQDVNAVAQLTVSDTAPQVSIATQLGLPVGSLSRISKFTASVTTTPTLFNHGLGAVPDIVLISINGTSSAAASVQYDTATLSSTQVKLTGSASLSVTCLAIKF